MSAAKFLLLLLSSINGEIPPPVGFDFWVNNEGKNVITNDGKKFIFSEN